MWKLHWYCDRLSTSRNNLETRFADLLNFTIQPWMTVSFDCDPHNMHENIPEEVTEMICNVEFQIKLKKEVCLNFGSWSEFWQLTL